MSCFVLPRGLLQNRVLTLCLNLCSYIIKNNYSILQQLSEFTEWALRLSWKNGFILYGEGNIWRGFVEETGTITGALLQLLQQVITEGDCSSVSHVT